MYAVHVGYPVRSGNQTVRRRPYLDLFQASRARSAVGDVGYDIDGYGSCALSRDSVQSQARKSSVFSSKRVVLFAIMGGGTLFQTAHTKFIHYVDVHHIQWLKSQGGAKEAIEWTQGQSLVSLA